MSAPRLRLQRASFAFDDLRPLLDDVDLHFPLGWTGLVGPNGAGKTTLLRLLAGDLPCPGLRAEPPGLVVHRLDQRLDLPSEAVQAFAWAWDKPALRLQSLLGLDPEALERWPTLSPGERRRWQVGAARWTSPDALLLDEPGNHLDVEARERLVEALRDFPGIGVLVSHDRALLDALTTRTVHLTRGRVRVVDAPWSRAEAVWAAEDAERRDQLASARRADARARRQLVQARQRAEGAGRARSLRGVDPRDRDARSVNRKAAAAKAEAAHLRTLGRALTAADRAAQTLAAAERPEDLGRDLVFPFTPCRKAVLAQLSGDVMVGDQAVLVGVDLILRRTDRIWVSGPNGAGKSTLLRALVRQVMLAPERVLVLPQELGPADVEVLLGRLGALPADGRGRVLGLVAALGVRPQRLVASARPSPGEARKLALALGLADDRALLVLDEPTHHLDLPARRRLEAALRHYPGALLLVTHDEALGAAVATGRWRVGGGGGRRGRARRGPVGTRRPGPPRWHVKGPQVAVGAASASR